jgi:intracellular septation protein A
MTERVTPARPALTALLSLLPASAQAQYIPPIFIAAALSPLLVILLAIVLGLLARSCRVGLRHTLLILLWVLLFGLASYFIENDYVIWTPMVLYAAHSLLIVVLILANIVKRIRTARRKGIQSVDPH